MSDPSASPFPFRLEFPPELPISSRAEEITAAIQANSVVILAGETGSGKTTQIPKMCLAAGRGSRGRIACTQPRRVAALSVSRRVAEEMNVRWGREVGCKIRFNDETTRDTVVKFLTDGMLLAEVQGDPLLREYDTIIIDEAHERSLNIDFLLGHLRTLRYKRPELKIVITSATIDTAAFSAAFDDAPIIQVEGRTYPVEVIYAPLDELGRDYTDNDANEDQADLSAVASAKAEALHYIDGAVEAVERIVGDSPGGDILVFLPSERDIREVRDLLEGRRLRDTEIVPLFGRLSNAEQQRVFAPTQRRKLVLATNIAETSLTIPGIRFVVDTGLARISRYSPQARTRRLPIEPVSQSSADQRKGRSGRVADGVCVRLYSEKDFLERPRFTQPEIQRANLADVILRMKAFGLGDIERFPFINMPAAKSIRAGYSLLEELGAIETCRAGSPDPAGSASAVSVSAPSQPSDDRRDQETPPYIVQLTPLGRELARLPVDPTVGRMILQARTEKAVREVLIIAAGLSIQDPRERPLDKQEQADAAHRRFRHPDSDFLTLLNIWDVYHDEFENLSQARLRRFCRDHFLSYTRMREWRDIHAQLLDVLEQRDDFKFTSIQDGLAANPKPKTQNPKREAPEDPLAFGTPSYRAIHRSILAGLLGNIATYDEENALYKATHDRRVNLFPGSVLFRREDPRKRPTDASQRDAQKKGSKAPRWIMTAEIMETSRLFARTCARLDPAWALDLGSHLIRVSHSEPFWNVDAGRVMVKQRTRLYGLELDSRSVSYGKIDPVHATEIFIREGLVNDTVTFPLDFIAHNRKVRENVEAILTRTRDTGYLNLDESAYRFYAARLLAVGASLADARAPSSGAPTPVSSVAELVDLVRERRGADPDFLMMSPDDLHDPDAVTTDAASFPTALPLENTALPLNYAYKPGQADDGVTLDVNVREAEALNQAALDWAVPGHLEPKVEHYLRSLPKELRRAFVPLAETAKSLAAALRCRAGSPDPAASGAAPGRRGQETPPYTQPTLAEALAFSISERFRVAIDPAIWADKPPPEHLRVRVRVLDDHGRELAASRELAEIHAAIHAEKREASATIHRAEPEVWRRARSHWEKAPQTTWTFGHLPEHVLVTEQAGVPVHAFPALTVETDGVALRLFKTPEDAHAQSQRGVARLLELELSRDLGWLERDLRALREIGPLAATLAPLESLQADAFLSLRRWLTDPARVGRANRPGEPDRSASAKSQLGGDASPYLSPPAFAAALESSRADLRGLVPRFVELLREILTLRQSLLVHPHPYPTLDRDLSSLIPADFLRRTPHPQLAHFPRYLKALKLRADRFRQNPQKDAERAAQLAPYLAAAAKLAAASNSNPSDGGRVPPPAKRSLRGEGTAPPSAAPSAAVTPAADSSNAVDAFRWLVEEFRVSVFAQELGTAEPISAAKLDRALAAFTGRTTASAPTPADSAPIRPMTIASDKKTAPVKSLGALDRLFSR